MAGEQVSQLMNEMNQKVINSSSSLHVHVINGHTKICSYFKENRSSSWAKE